MKAKYKIKQRQPVEKYPYICINLSIHLFLILAEKKIWLVNELKKSKFLL